jgi:hypothetical protein
MSKITLQPTQKQYEAYQALANPEIDTIFFGGSAGGGKSWLICESRLVRAYLYPGYRSFIAREELKRLMQSTYVTWTKVCQHHKIPQDDWKLNGQYNYIEFKNGSRIDLLDIKMIPSDPLYERFGSLEYTDGAIEEAGEVNYLAFDVLKSRIGRHMNKEFGLRPTMLITGNPKKNWTYTEFYKPWKQGSLPSNATFIQALYSDNQHTAEEYGKQLEQIRDRVMKERLMYGNWDYADDDNALMSHDSITDIYTNTIKPSEQKYFVADIARMGSDRSVFTYWKGFYCYKIETFTKQGIDIISDKIKEALRSEHIPYSHAIADEDGIGGGVVDVVRGIKGFMANRVPFPNRLTGNPDNYRNLKSQCAYLLADFVNDHKVRVDCDKENEESLTEELATLKRKDPDREGKLEIESKEKQKEMINRSPDLADCMIMRMYFELEQPTRETQNIDPLMALINRPMKERGIDNMDYK